MQELLKQRTPPNTLWVFQIKKQIENSLKLLRNKFILQKKITFGFDMPQVMADVGGVVEEEEFDKGAVHFVVEEEEGGARHVADARGQEARWSCNRRW